MNLLKGLLTTAAAIASLSRTGIVKRHTFRISEQPVLHDAAPCRMSAYLDSRLGQSVFTLLQPARSSCYILCILQPSTHPWN